MLSYNEERETQRERLFGVYVDKAVMETAAKRSRDRKFPFLDIARDLVLSYL